VGIPVTDAIDDAEIDTRTGVDIYQWLQEGVHNKSVADAHYSWRTKNHCPIG